MGCLKTPSCDLGRLSSTRCVLSSRMLIFDLGCLRHALGCRQQSGAFIQLITIRVHSKFNDSTRVHSNNQWSANTTPITENNQAKHAIQYSKPFRTRHHLLQLSIQDCSTNCAAKLCHWHDLCLSQISQIWRNHKTSEVKTFANAINKKFQVCPCCAMTPLKSGFFANHALQHMYQSGPQQLLSLARQCGNRCPQAVAKHGQHTTLGM